jgi:hypothetical protein
MTPEKASAFRSFSFPIMVTFREFFEMLYPPSRRLRDTTAGASTGILKNPELAPVCGDYGLGIPRLAGFTVAAFRSHRVHAKLD